jgi:hypothetical protein
MFFKNIIFLLLIIMLLKLNIANGIGVENNDLNQDTYSNDYNIPNYGYIETETNIDSNYSAIFTPEEFLQNLSNDNLPNIAIIVNNDLTIEGSAIYKLPNNLTVLGFIKIKNNDSITKRPKNIMASAIYILNCKNLNDFGNTTSPIAIN